MGRALLDMRENLKNNAEEEHRRSWSTQGLAEIGLILRKHTLSPRELYESVTRLVVKYVNANQGGIFLLAGEHQDHLELAACYAYDRKKYMEKIIAVGDGLLGQCVLEKQTVNLLAVPRDYIRITSGLGDALPTNILIVPLKVNEQVEGVLELASFHKFEPYQIAFLEKLGESIAAAIAGIQVNKKTRDLLDQTQEQAEQMKASQEELRQSMEELSATQEEMSRKEREYIERINALENALARQVQLPHLSPNGREKNLLEHREQIASNF
jgi:GAF domain-containing protein